ncbi:exo 1,3/1,4-beta-D-glucan glucohydrolase [Vibrio sp. ZSDE26]|uniref:Exo 1,3/1,4-beta-D-glucan glucohydrolase n=1 Tax=Vibrio amylolyticus TaxID=2847292 RepID=A0A9X2BGV2_9VIBR|nr:glycoside hydrolase family 3 protein [Vibrio amylolyticus]MCK6263329.1 exo 1,3/1,4-beta-D-glucan glucohydrolase [Vibrio amylolyticus]
MTYRKTLISTLISSALFLHSTSYADTEKSQLPYFEQWPEINSLIKENPGIENRVAKILAKMTLEEKVGQMIQPNLQEVTPEEAKQYKLGSLLNGGGSWPSENKYATADDWAKESDKYWLALKEAYAERGFDIPFIWATDAVHGHNNVFRATVFPHNIGLGAARNPDLIEQIGQATAKEVVATGLDWTFAPTVAAPRDYRWGRVYEGYSEDPEVIHQYAAKMVQGLQGGKNGIKSDRYVISNVKHWVGDGGTFEGVDRGENHSTEEYLRNIHATGYFSGLDAGAQVVMSSFNSWHDEANYDQTGTGEYNYKLHGSKYLLNDILKEKMGFDGIIVTDWNGQGEINGCSSANCPEAVNAGNDVFMVTARNDWQAFYRNVIEQVNEGIIPMERIDDAVTRILRVKMRAQLWEKPQPSLRTYAGDQDILGADAHRELARQAVSESLVLLKNNDLLPLKKDKKYLVVGSAANSIQKQTGGWSLTWQGTENEIDRDFPGAQTLLMAMKDVVGDENVITDISLADDETIALVVFGEDPYAEMFGDIKRHQTLEYSTLKSRYGKDLELIKELNSAKLPIVSVFYSGRPLYVNEEINLSDSFVAAWLPGTEAGGITDVLFAKDGADFSGSLSYSWPKLKCSTTINRHAPNIPDYQTPDMEQDINGEHKPLFPYSYGLSYASGSNSPASEQDLNNLPLDPRDFGCGQDKPDDAVATDNLEIFGRSSSGEFIARLGGETTGWSNVDISSGSETDIGNIKTRPINYNHQQDALEVTFYGEGARQIYMQTYDEQGVDKNAYLNADSTLQFDIDMKTTAPDDFILSMHCEWPCHGELKLGPVLPKPSDPTIPNWETIKIPLACLAEEGMVFPNLNSAFLLYSNSSEEIKFNLGEIRFVPKSIDPAEDALSCDMLQGETLPPLNKPKVDVTEQWPDMADWKTNTDDWQGIDGHVFYTKSVSGDETTIHVEYDASSPESYKGIVFVKGPTQNLSLYQEGTLSFDLFIESYGQPANDGENPTHGLVFKIESEEGPGDDYLLPRDNYPTGEWHHVVTPIKDLNNGSLDIEKVNTPIALLPSWSATQAGFKFQIKNIELAQ